MDIKEKKIYSKPKVLINLPFSFCPGCHHGIASKLLAEVIEEFDIADKTIALWPIGCAVMLYEYFDLDCIIVPHGRAPAAATALKRVQPDKIIFTYQGDGDLAAIGTAEIIHAANRGENITVLFINNAVYGMTGGQMAPTTLLGQKTTTTPEGRTSENEGVPIRMCELLNTLEKPAYIARVSLISPKNVAQAKNAIRKAFKFQIENKGFSFVEIISNCPTNWQMTPFETLEYIKEKMEKQFPLGVFREPKEEELK